MSKKVFFWLTAFFALGLILRFLYFNNITFGYDQVRDAIQAMSIIKDHHLKILGPTTDIRGLFHGPLYWYLLSPLYFFSGGNPAVPRVFLILFNLLNVFFIYFFARKFFKNETIALISAFFMAVFFEATQYARWLSNPPLAILFIGLFFYGFWMVLNRKDKGLPLMFFAWSLCVEFQFFLVYLGIFFVFGIIYVFIRNREHLVKSAVKYFWLYLGGLFFFSPFLISEIKFKFQGSKAILGFFSQHSAEQSPLVPKLINFYNRLIGNISYDLVFHNEQIAGILFIVFLEVIAYFVVYRRKNFGQLLFLFVWLVSPLLIYPLEKNNSYFLNIGNIYPIILMSAFFIVYVAENFSRWRRAIILALVALISIMNITMIYRENRNGEELFSVQEQQILNNEEIVIDYIYGSSKGQEFALNTVTNPLFVNSTWSYLLDWYGKRRYGYMPVWAGYPLNDVGSDIKFADHKGSVIGLPFYLIIEPGPGVPDLYVKAYSKYEDLRSRLLERKNIGTFTVEKRVLLNELNFDRELLIEFMPNGKYY